MKYTNTDLLRIARERATAAGLPQPKTKADVESLTGFAFNGPDPEVIGRTYSVPVVRPNWN